MLKKILAITAASVFVLVLSVSVFADQKHIGNNNNQNQDNSSFDTGKELTKSKCVNATGDPVIDVTQKVQNDSDSGQASNYWAFDYYNRHITVWSTGGNTYCAIVTYNGNFYAVPGQVGPGNTPPGAKIDTNTNQPVNGPFEGGRRVTLTGTLKTSPSWATNGSVGITNYQCDINGNCPGFVSWPGQYFNPLYTYNDDWWGWKYNGGSHGTWINAISGNSGNIL